MSLPKTNSRGDLPREFVKGRISNKNYLKNL